MSQTKQDTNDLHAVSHTELVDIIGMCATADVPLMVFGTPGIAKSATMQQWTEANGYAFLPVHAGNIPPEDFSGLAWPNKETNEVDRLMPDVISAANKLHKKTGKPVYVFFDEINHAPLAAQGPLYNIVHDRQSAGFAFPPGTRIGAAGNPEGTGSISEELSRALLDRFMVVKYAGPTFDEYDEYANAHQFNPIVRAYLREHPVMLNKFDPDEQISPTPRAWHMLSKLFDVAKSDGMKMRAAQSVVGSAAAAKINAFIEMYGKIPKFDDIVRDAEGALLPKSFSAQYMTALMLAHKLPQVWATKDADGTMLIQAAPKTDAANNRKLIHKAVGTYLGRLPGEVQSVAASALVTTKSPISGDAAIHELAVFLSEAEDTGIKKHMKTVRELSVMAKSVNA